MATTAPLATIERSQLADTAAQSLPPTEAPVISGLPRPVSGRRMVEVSKGTWAAGGVPSPMPMEGGSNDWLPSQLTHDSYNMFQYPNPNSLDWSLLSDLFVD